MSANSLENSSLRVGSINEDRYLPLAQQNELVIRMQNIINHESRRNNFFIHYDTELCMLALAPVYLMSWRAGFRAYSLSRYGKARIVTIVCGLAFPGNGVVGHKLCCTEKLTEPFRPETYGAYAWRWAAIHQPALFSTIVGPIGITFMFARGSGVMVVPESVLKNNYFRTQLLGKLKPYVKNLVIASVISTAFMAFLGAASFHQTKLALAKMGRQSVIYKEDQYTNM